MYKCYIDDDLIFDDEIVLDVSQSILSDIRLNDNDIMEMEYGFGSTTTFADNEMLDDISEFDLEDIVKDADKSGYSKYPYSPGYETGKIYDYREFDLKKNNIKVMKMFPMIKKGYENVEKY